MASIRTPKDSSVCPDYEGTVSFVSSLSSLPSICSEASYSTTTGAVASKIAKPLGSSKTQSSTKDSNSQKSSSQQPMSSISAISQQIVSSPTQEKSGTSSPCASEGSSSKSASKSATGDDKYSFATFDTISSSGCNESAEDTQTASEGGQTIADWPLVEISASVTSSSLKCCAQVEQVRTNNILRLKVALTEQQICKAENKARNLHRINDKLVQDVTQVQDQIETNKCRKQEVSQESSTLSKGIQLLIKDVRRLKQEAQHLQNALKTRKQRVCDLESQIKSNGEEFLAAAIITSQKIERCNNDIAKLMAVKASIDIAAQKADEDLQCSSKLLNQVSLALEKILSKLQKCQCQLPKIQSEIATTRQACEEKQQDVESMRANNPRARSVQQDLKQETASYRRRAETLLEAMQTRDCEAGQLQEAVEKLSLQQINAEKAMGEKQRRLIELSGRLETTHARWNQAIRELSQAKMAYNSLHERYIGLLGEVAC